MIPVSGSRARLNIGLFVVALVLACAAVFCAVLVVQDARDDDRARAEQEEYGDVLGAARAEVEAFINIDYRKAQESIDAVAAGATGEFAEQYGSSADGVVTLLTQEKSVMAGEVLWAGVTDLDGDSASVLAATTGTVQNQSTDNQEVARYFRIKLDLQKIDGEWLTSNLEFVG